MFILFSIIIHSLSFFLSLYLTFLFFFFFFFIILFFFFFFFFFFQAEDGIRDADVTGVQTCALPISQKYVIVATGNIYEDIKQAVSAAKKGAEIIAVIRSTGQSLLDYVPHGATRSEERRVGKECRCWWSSYP